MIFSSKSEARGESCLSETSEGRRRAEASGASDGNTVSAVRQNLVGSVE